VKVNCKTQYPLVQATKSGAELKAVLKLSKHLISFMEGLLAVSPYVNGPFNFHVPRVLQSLNCLP
jgi:hypothetical protein